MKMVLNGRPLTVLVVVSFWLLLICGLSYGGQSDIDCLKGIKDALEDPYGYLTSWNFNNNTEVFICKFTGIDCWNPDENKVLNIRLSDMALKGQFPSAVKKCTTLIGLDLSNNKLFGNIPQNISNLVRFVSSLDLSSNNFSGQIPVDLSNCSYLNVLKLDHNKLTGQIPAELSLISRLKQFSVANNILTGPVPYFGANSSITADSYANNPGLCGFPLDPCQSTWT
ncbi:hypothetical protein ACB092_12G190900 [Castanea dentata]